MFATKTKECVMMYSKASSVFAVALSFLLMLALATSCSNSSEKNNNGNNSNEGATKVGAEGGTITHDESDQLVEVDIPSGALSEKIEVTIEPTTGVPEGNVGEAFAIGPDGTEFSKAVTIGIEAPESLPAGVEFDDLRVARAASESWEVLDAQDRDSNSLKVSGETPHFSAYGLIGPGGAQKGADAGMGDTGADASSGGGDAGGTADAGPSDVSSTGDGSSGMCATKCGKSNHGKSCAGCPTANCGGGSSSTAPWSCSCSGNLTWDCKSGQDAGMTTDTGSSTSCATTCGLSNAGKSCAGCSNSAGCGGGGSGGSWSCTCGDTQVWVCN